MQNRSFNGGSQECSDGHLVSADEFAQSRNSCVSNLESGVTEYGEAAERALFMSSISIA